MNVDSIEKAVQQLTLQELAEFRSWFEQFDSENWDAQIEQDVANGNINHLAEEALADFEAGRAKKL